MPIKYALFRAFLLAAGPVFMAAVYGFGAYPAWSAPRPKSEPTKAEGVTQEEFVLDAVVASVDGKPITLHDLTERLEPPRTLSLKEASLDPQARQVLDALIMDRLVEAEAENRKIKINDDDVNHYIAEVARRNNLTADGLSEALKQQNKTMESYREQVRVDILKTRLTSQLMQGGAGVTDQDIDNYINEHPEMSKSGSKSKLRQAFVAFQGRAREEAESRVNELRQEFAKGVAFADLARKYSDAPEAEEGGSLGMVAEEDLSPEVFDLVLATSQGEISKTLETPEGLRVFFVEKRFMEQDERPQELRDEVKKVLERQKMEEKVQAYFSTEIQKLHSVDKKI